MKKLLALLLTLALTFSLVACTSEPTESSKTESSKTESSEESKEESSDVESSEEESQEESKEETGDSANLLDDVYNAVADAFYGENAEEFKASLMAMDIETFESMVGVKADLVDEFISYKPMMMNIDTIIVVKAAEGKLADVEAALNLYRENNIKSMDPAQGGMSYPGQLEQATAAQVAVVGDYVCYFLAGKGDSVLEGAELIESLETSVNAAIEAATEILG